jgi:hypothetical protein
LDACSYSNLETKIFLPACLSCWDPDCCKNRSHIVTAILRHIDLRNGLKKNTLLMKMEVSINDFAIASVECEKACNAAHLETLKFFSFPNSQMYVFYSFLRI